MASNPETLAKLDAVLTQIPLTRSRKMFGEVGVYFNEKMVAMLCDDQFFLKPTSAVHGMTFETAP
ncbi:TfoX/Sxy family protein, partial [Acinetobacter baumannii]